MSEDRVIRNAHRDKYSGAVIIDDEEAYRQARARKRLAREKEDLKDQVQSMKDELLDLRGQIQEITKQMNHRY